MPLENEPPRWTRSSSERSCYDLKFDEETEMCDKCREFSQRMNGHGKKPRKGTTPKCERIKLMKSESNLSRKKLQKLHFEEILETKGCTVNKGEVDLELSRNYLRQTPLKVRLVMN